MRFKSTVTNMEAMRNYGIVSEKCNLELEVRVGKNSIYNSYVWLKKTVWEKYF